MEKNNIFGKNNIFATCWLFFHTKVCIIFIWFFEFSGSVGPVKLLINLVSPKLQIITLQIVTIRASLSLATLLVYHPVCENPYNMFPVQNVS